MIKQAKDILGKKHLLIIGKTEVERKRFIDELIGILNLEFFRFPAHMTRFDQYYDFVKKEKLYDVWYQNHSPNQNQILDFHWDWISNNQSLIIMEEFDKMEEKWQIELLSIYLNEIENRRKGEKKIHLILSQEKESGLIDRLARVIQKKDDEKRTKKQMIEQSLGIVQL